LEQEHIALKVKHDQLDFDHQEISKNYKEVTDQL